MTVVSSENKISSDLEFIQRGRSSIYTLWTIEALELILGEVHISLYPSQRKNLWLC